MTTQRVDTVIPSLNAFANLIWSSLSSPHIAMRPSLSPSLTLTLAILLFSLLQLSTAAKSTAISFCKCICFNNSTIIALNPPSSKKSSSHRLEIRSPGLLDDISSALTGRDEAQRQEEKTPAKPHHKLTCADCTRAFCLDYNLPICKDATDEDVFTTCFRKAPFPILHIALFPFHPPTLSTLNATPKTMKTTNE